MGRIPARVRDSALTFNSAPEPSASAAMPSDPPPPAARLATGVSSESVVSSDEVRARSSCRLGSSAGKRKRRPASAPSSGVGGAGALGVGVGDGSGVGGTADSAPLAAASALQENANEVSAARGVGGTGISPGAPPAPPVEGGGLPRGVGPGANTRGERGKGSDWMRARNLDVWLLLRSAYGLSMPTVGLANAMSPGVAGAETASVPVSNSSLLRSTRCNYKIRSVTMK
jgi:hypothetical protein